MATPFADGGWYFLSSLETDQGQTLATVSYAIPDAGNCWPAANSNGAPYIADVNISGGQRLSFNYQRLENATSGAKECVLSGIDAVADVRRGLARFHYDGGFSGLLSAAIALEPFDGGVRLVERYAYNTGYAVYRDGALVLSHSNANIDGGSDLWGSYGIGAIVMDAGVTSCPASTSCDLAYARTVQFATSQMGDGTASDPGLKRRYAFLQSSGESRSALGGILSVTDDCDGGGCSPGKVQYLARIAGDGGWGKPLGDLGMSFASAIQDKRGNWTTWTARNADGGLEYTGNYTGVPTTGGVPDEGNALQHVNYSYSYSNNIQSVLTETRPSSVQSGANAVKTFFRNSTTNALERVEVSGYTKLLGGGVAAQTSRITYEYDGSGRLKRVAGPCDTSANPCPATAPSIEYEYHAGSGSFSSGRLYKVIRKYNGGASGLETKFDDYTPLGDPQIVTDENGIDTHFTYSGNVVASRKLDFADDAGVKPEWIYTWENQKLVAVRFPEGNYEILCYRATTSPSCSGAWTDRLMARTKSADASGSSWSERIEYMYWPDGSLKAQTFSTPSGTRSQRSFAADPHRRSTQTTVGSGIGAFTEVVAHDGADNVFALGNAYNAAPAFCGGTGSLSTLCSQLGYDAANRLGKLDTFPTTNSSSVNRVCLDYDSQGNVKRVTSGCTGSDTCGYTSGSLSSCTGVASNNYVTDDFGHVVEASLAGTDNGSGSPGVFRFEYDVRGNLIKQQTEAQRSAVSPARYVLHTYDQLNRRIATHEVRNTTQYLVARWSFDDDVTSIADPPGGCGVTPMRTNGRVRAIVDPVFTRWFQYDAEGRVTMELRVELGQTTCSTSAPLMLGYTRNGNLASLRYAYGREVRYVHGTGALTDRESAVSVDIFLLDGGVVQRTLIDNVMWEPFGSLRGYRMNFPLDGGSTATLEREVGAASTALTAACPTSAISEANDLTGRIRSVRVWESATNIYRRSYVWRADQVERINSCYKGGPDYISEVYSADSGVGFGYDGTGQVLGANGPTFDSNGGPMRQRRYTYDSRGNLSDMRVDQYGNGYTFQFDGGSATRRDWLTRISGGDSFNIADLSYDRDGRVFKIAGGVDSSGSAPALLLGYESDDPGLIGPGSDTVMTTSTRVTASGSSPTYTYWYDTLNRRQAKDYPLNGIYDYFFYDLDHQLLQDRGNETTSYGGPYPIDEYVWLGGAPVAVYRGKLDANLRHQPDDNGQCSRLGDGVSCGVYFIVTDHIGKPVLALNGARKIAGAGEYEPFGAMNRVQWWWATSHPYTKAVEGPSFLSFSQKELGMEVGFRAHFPLIDTEQDCIGNVREGPSMWNVPWGTMYEVLGGYNKGDLWSKWQTPADVGTDWRSMSIGWGTVAGNCHPTNCGTACPQASGVGHNYSGFALKEYEYRRFESGVTPYFPALRFPGQYYDSETDLNENWHRYYYPFGGRYLAPDPMLQTPNWIAVRASRGVTSPAYSYARNNPLANIDTDGREDEPAPGCLDRYWGARGNKTRGGGVDCICTIKDDTAHSPKCYRKVRTFDPGESSENTVTMPSDCTGYCGGLAKSEGVPPKSFLAITCPPESSILSGCSPTTNAPDQGPVRVCK